MIPYILLADNDFSSCTSFEQELEKQVAYAAVKIVEDGQSFLAFLAGTLGFVVFGANRIMSVGADSPCFSALTWGRPMCASRESWGNHLGHVGEGQQVGARLIARCNSNRRRGTSRRPV